MLRKVAIILVAAFLKYNAFARALVVLFVLGIAIYFQTLKKPFFSENLNELEYRAIIVSLFTIYFGLFYYVTPDDYGKFLTIIVIIASNIYFLSYWALQVMAVQFEYFLKLLNYCPKIKAIVLRIKQKIESLDQFISKKTPTTGHLDKVKLTSQISSINKDLGSDSMGLSQNETAKIFPKKVKE